ncbi:hypothetical protein BH11BAC1_BH11BAC1_22600 [soil metagenome]
MRNQLNMTVNHGVPGSSPGGGALITIALKGVLQRTPFYLHTFSKTLYSLAIIKIIN